jgi:hypothetical protein
MSFLNQLGANLGPGILLAVLAGMAFKAGIANPSVSAEFTKPGPRAPQSATGAGPTEPPASEQSERVE